MSDSIAEQVTKCLERTFDDLSRTHHAAGYGPISITLDYDTQDFLRLLEQFKELSRYAFVPPCQEIKFRCAYGGGEMILRIQK